VLGAITSTQQRLKLYNRVPTNGLVRDLARVARDRARSTQNTW
jgi:peptide subunit release factor 1 (eRF1)